MNELIEFVRIRTGLSAEQARAAAQATVLYLKAKLPSPVTGQLDELLKNAQKPIRHASDSAAPAGPAHG